MDSTNIVEDWYAIEKSKNFNEIIELLELNHNRIEKYIDNKLIDMENKILSSIDQHFKNFEKKEKEKEKELDYKKVHELLYELKNLKEREINLMIREKIPFPFGLPHKINSPKVSFLPFSRKL